MNKEQISTVARAQTPSQAGTFELGRRGTLGLTGVLVAGAGVAGAQTTPVADALGEHDHDTKAHPGLAAKYGPSYMDTLKIKNALQKKIDQAIEERSDNVSITVHLMYTSAELTQAGGTPSGVEAHFEPILLSALNIIGGQTDITFNYTIETDLTAYDFDDVPECGGAGKYDALQVIDEWYNENDDFQYDINVYMVGGPSASEDLTNPSCGTAVNGVSFIGGMPMEVGSDGGMNVWEHNISSGVAAHELAHALGLDDRYPSNGYHVPGTNNNLMNATIGNTTIDAYQNEFIRDLWNLSPLAIELAKFTAENNNCETIRLKWTTATESQNQHFVLQASTDGKTWTEMGRVPGAGTSIEPINYELSLKTSELQAKLHNFLGGDVAFRLTDVDVDGAESHSPVRSLDLSECIQGKLTAYPSLLQAGATLTIVNTAEDFKGKVDIELFDGIGKLVDFTTQSTDEASINYQIPGNLASGLYIGLITHEGKTTPVRFVIGN